MKCRHDLKYAISVPGSSLIPQPKKIFVGMTLNCSPGDLVIGWLGFMSYPYLPTPPLGQDMTQGHFLSGV